MPEVIKEDKSPPPYRPIFEKEKELLEFSTTEKGPVIFNLQKELEKVKILVLLFELLKQTTYKAQVS